MRLFFVNQACLGMGKPFQGLQLHLFKLGASPCSVMHSLLAFVYLQVLVINGKIVEAIGESVDNRHVLLAHLVEVWLEDRGVVGDDPLLPHKGVKQLNKH